MAKHSTKKALLVSVLSMTLSASMFVGTTFAWFTDSVESGVNQIVSGNLDVELTHKGAGDSAFSTVKGVTNLFKNANGGAMLWEPNASSSETFKVSNEGSLALKYTFEMNYTNATKTPEGKTLADVLTATVRTPDGQESTATLADFTYDSTLVAGASEEFTVTIAWPQGANDNAFNVKGGLSIDLGVKVFATQYAYEYDGNGNNYDENAPYSVWDGVVPAEMPETLVVDGATQTVHIQDAAAFAYLSTLTDKWAEFYTDGNGRTYTNYANGAGANYYYSGLWKLSLETDVDLGNYAIEPVKVVLGEATGASVFNGNGHKIRNINTTTGLFADGNRVSYTDLDLINVTATNGALTGYSTSNISKVTVKNANISGTDYVGGVVGSTYGSVENCSVTDSSILATGKEAGGLVGYIATSSEGVVASNTVRNVSVYAGNRAAGLVAQVNVNVKVYKNVIDTVTVGAADKTTYQPDAVVSNALDQANVYDNTVINATVATSAVAIVTDEAEFKDSLKNATADSKVVLADDISVNGKWDNRYDGGKKNVPMTIDGMGKTLKIVGAIDDGGNYQSVFYFQQDAVVKNLTFDLSEATSTAQGRVRAIAAKADLVVDNCTFIGNLAATKGSGVTFGMGSGAAVNEVDVTVTNCTFIDLPRGLYDNESGKDAKTLTITGNKFVNSGINVCAGESITFTGNELIDTSVRLVTYQNGATVKVTAIDNNLSANVGQVIAIMKVTNIANVTKQDEFILY